MKLNDVVISSQISLRRNFADLPFVSKLTDSYEAKLVHKAIYNIFENELEFYSLNKLSVNKCNFFVEELLISKELVENRDIAMFAFSQKNDISIMLNEEDHLKLMCKLNGDNLCECFKKISVYDDKILSKIEMAYNDEFGFLSSCANITGTGLKAYAILFLPALTINNVIKNLVMKCDDGGIELQNLYTEKNNQNSYYYKISNNFCIGKSEEEIIAYVQKHIDFIAALELELRQTITKTRKIQIVDSVLRAYGILNSCKLLAFEEMMMYIGKIRLGVLTGLVSIKNEAALDNLFKELAPAHLCDDCGLELNKNEDEQMRAKEIKNFFCDKDFKEINARY